MLILTPAAKAAQQLPISQSSEASSEQSVEEKLSSIIQNVDRSIYKLEKKLDHKQDTSEELKSISQLYDEVVALDQSVSENFIQLEKDLQQQKTPAAILLRHQEMLNTYRMEFAVLLKNLLQIQFATNAAELKAKVMQTKEHFQSRKIKRSKQPFDPNSLPSKNALPKEKVKPKVNKQDFKNAGLYNTPFQKVAALGDFVYDELPNATDPAYLAETTEVVITDAIKSQAEALDHDLLKIFHWVRNNIEWVPTWGAAKSADLTLLTKQGNAMEIASLTIALLRASQIPSRYVHGTIDVPAQRFSNWVSDTITVEEAAQLASAGGIPITALVQGGKIKMVRMEHIWVEAASDYFPSRGALNRKADAWLEMDPSFKQYTYTDTINPIAITGIDVNALRQNFLESGTFDATGGWGTGFDPNVVKNALTQSEIALSEYFANNDVTLDNIVGGKKIIIQEFPSLPSSIPNAIVVEGARYSELPSSLRHSITIELYDTLFDKQLGSPSLTLTIPLPKIDLKRLGITYIPDTPSDAAYIQSQIEAGASELSSYLISLRPQIRLDDTELATGSSIGMGSDQFLDIVIQSPYETKRISYNQVAGDEMVVGINAAGITTEMVQQRSQTYTEVNAPENLHIISLNYWSQADLFSQVTARQFGMKAMRTPSIGLFSSPLSVVYSFGIPLKGYYIKRSIDIKQNSHAVVGGTAVEKKQLNEQMGLIHSYLESSILEQVLNNWQGTGLSAVQVLLDANQQGIKIYEINAANAEQILPNLQIPAEALSEINIAIQTGLEVAVPERQPVKTVGSSGFGYIIIDPITGDGAYKISGGLDGGEGEEACAVREAQPLAKAIADILLTILILALLAIIAVGTRGQGAPALADMMGAFGLSALTFPATAGTFCNPIPQDRDNEASRNVQHNICANARFANMYPNLDVCVAAEGIGARKFDAYNGSILWEVKTYNFDNWNPFFYDIRIPRDIQQAKRESAIAKSCGYEYWYTVGDSRHPDILEQYEQGFILNYTDNLEIDPVNCLSP
jgi:hypothetical protein